MNAKQQALYDRVVAAGGKMWIEASREYRIGRRSGIVVGAGDVNVMNSMFDEQTRDYIPGNGFKRVVVLKLLKEQKISEYDYENPQVWNKVTERYLVEVLA